MGEPLHHFRNHVQNARRPRRGHTLIELVTASVASGLLLAGLGSVMLIANQVANTPAASTERVEAAALVNELANDLRFATFFVARSANMIEFVVADRNNDGSGERIRYEWSGVPEAPLVKTTNGGTPVTVVDSVQYFQLTLNNVSETSSYTATSESAESILASYTTSPSGAPYGITQDSFVAQRVDPSNFSGAPAGATSWNATRIDFMAQRQGSGETLRVQLRSAGEPSFRPTSDVLGEVPILEDLLSGAMSWNTVTFSSPVRGLSLNRPYSIVWRGTTGEAGTAGSMLKDGSAATGVSTSIDAGANWSFSTTDRVFYRLYGTYTSRATPVSVTRNFVSRVGVALQSGSAALSRIDTSIPLLNRPELLSAYWRADFDSNPTTLDLTRDGTDDWTMSGGVGFNNGTLVGGVWQSNGSLESRPKNNFTAVTTLEVRCRNTSVGGNGAELRIQVDRQGGLHAPLIVRVQRQADGSQTLTLCRKSNDATEVTLLERTKLTSDFVRYRLTILPANNIVNLAINDYDEGSFVYSTYAPSGDDRFLTFCANTSTAEYDYVELRVSE
jgi:hypothetical protein